MAIDILRFELCLVGSYDQFGTDQTIPRDLINQQPFFSFSFTHFSHKILFWNIYNCEYRTHALYVFRRISDGWRHIDELLFFLFRYFYNETIAKSTSSSLGIDIYVKVVNKNDTWKIQITVVSVTLTFVCILNFDLNDLIYASSCEQIVWRVS